MRKTTFATASPVLAATAIAAGHHLEHAAAASNRAEDQGHVDTGQHGHLGHLHR